MIEYSSGTVDAASLSDRVAELAAQLVDSSTSCLALYADNGIDWVVADLACLESDVRIVPFQPGSLGFWSGKL